MNHDLIWHGKFVDKHMDIDIKDFKLSLLPTAIKLIWAVSKMVMAIFFLPPSGMKNVFFSFTKLGILFKDQVREKTGADIVLISGGLLSSKTAAAYRQDGNFFEMALCWRKP